jgi:hypothetical protein
MTEVTGVVMTIMKKRRRRRLPQYLGLPMPPTTLAVRLSCPQGVCLASDSEPGPVNQLRPMAKVGLLVEEIKRRFLSYGRPTSINACVRRKRHSSLLSLVAMSPSLTGLEFHLKQPKRTLTWVYRKSSACLALVPIS